MDTEKKIYKPRQPQNTSVYRIFKRFYDDFKQNYDTYQEKYGFFRAVIERTVGKIFIMRNFKIRLCPYTLPKMPFWNEVDCCD